ncbi:MAG: hypothetical protein OXI80_20110 [Caldilineaceae bacterium]|nr:hypothetical protein [Caldilineaceae bacterium]
MPDPCKMKFDIDGRLTADEQSILNQILRRLAARDKRQRRERRHNR